MLKVDRGRDLSAQSGAVRAGFFRENAMINRTATLRRLLAEEQFIDMPVAYDPLGGRLIESLGFKTVYNGGFVTGASR
jgi:2-methylisocitrate lyase-like PEP mutase family enzyme